VRKRTAGEGDGPRGHRNGKTKEGTTYTSTLDIWDNNRETRTSSKKTTRLRTSKGGNHELWSYKRERLKLGPTTPASTDRRILLNHSRRAAKEPRVVGLRKGELSSQVVVLGFDKMD